MCVHIYKDIESQNVGGSRGQAHSRSCRLILSTFLSTVRMLWSWTSPKVIAGRSDGNMQTMGYDMLKSCYVGLFHIFLGTCDKEFPNSDSCKYLERISSKKCRKEAGEMPQWKENLMRKILSLVSSLQVLLESKCSAVHSRFPRSSCSRSQPVAQQADCWNTSGTDSTEMLKVAAPFHTPWHWPMYFEPFSIQGHEPDSNIHLTLEKLF